MRWIRPLSLAVFLVVPVIVAGCDWPEPKQVRRNLHLPEPGFVADAGRGKGLFQTNCASCHGLSARGTRQGPPLVHKIYRPKRHADMAFHLAVKSGVRQHHWNFGHMPPKEGLIPENVGHIIAYVRQEQRRAGIQ